MAQGKELGEQIHHAIQLSFTDSITAIYRYAIVLAVIALVLACFLPELPLRKADPQAQPMMLE